MWNNFNNPMQNEGGFMDVSVNDSTTQGDSKPNFNRGHNCIPVMIAHMLRYGENLTVWGTTAKVITFVAIVRHIEPFSTKVTFKFEDESGSIKGIKWLEGDDIDYESPVKVDSYARVFGLIRNQDNENYVLICKVQPLDHLNELLTHLMEVTVLCLEGEKMVNEVGVLDSSSANDSLHSKAYIPNISNHVSGLNAEQQIVLDIIQDSDPEYGAERSIIKSRVAPHLAPKVDQILEFLAAEGHVYTTKTDDYYKAI